jgi:hypothetical protein
MPAVVLLQDERSRAITQSKETAADNSQIARNWKGGYEVNRLPGV